MTMLRFDPDSAAVAGPFTILADVGAALAARLYLRRSVPVSQEAIRVVVADDHTLVRAGIEALLQTAPDISVVGEAASGPDAVALAARLCPDVVVMDLDIPGGDGAAATRELADRLPETRVLVLTLHTEEERLLPLLSAGARGYLAKTAADRELIDAIHVVAAGDVYVPSAVARRLAGSVPQKADQGTPHRDQYDHILSSRERSVLQLVAEGYNGPEIGERLGIAAKTVDTYKQRIEDELGLAHRTEYVRFAIGAGLLVA